MAKILVTQHEVLGRPYFTFKWEGNPHEPIQIDYPTYRQFKDLLPWNLDELSSEDYWLFNRKTFIRSDAGYWLAYHRFMVDWNRLLNCGRGIFCRFIMTLYIWGLAEVDDAEIPGWYCVLRRFGLR